MKASLKIFIFLSIIFLAFTNRASADWSWNDNSNGHHDDRGDKGDHGDDGDHHHHHHSGNGGGGIGGHVGGVAPEPVSAVLFLIGAGALALSYNQRKRVPVTA